MFGLDPVAVLDEADVFSWQVREAALTVWIDDQKAMFDGGSGG